MKTLSILKKAVAGALAAGSTLLISACYGAYYSYNDLATGKVTVPEATPDQYNVMVCAEFGPEDRACSMVSYDGSYWISSSVEHHRQLAEQEGFELCAGDEAGVLVRQCVTVPPTLAVFERNFDLEFAPEKK